MKILHSIKAYLKFLWKSKNQHGVHSPFVYNLVTRCFYDREKRSSYETLKTYRQDLLRNNKTIKCTDYGAGSRVFSSQERKISSIARKAGTSPKRARLLNRLVSYLRAKNALELGTSLGIGTVAIAAGNKVKITTLEGCPQTVAVAKKQFSKFELNQVRLRTGEFKENLADIAAENSKQLDLVFFDGNHQKQPTLEYFEKILPAAHNDTVFIFDDIHWSSEMEEAWDIIKNHPSVTVTIDTFFWGLVFFRKEQEKEHFTIRV